MSDQISDSPQPTSTPDTPSLTAADFLDPFDIPADPPDSQTPQQPPAVVEDDVSPPDAAFSQRSLTRPAPRMGKAAAAFACNLIGHPCPYGMCQKMTHEMFGTPACGSSAVLAWETARRRTPTTDPHRIPRGVPVYWSGGSSGFGHAATSIGSGKVVSTDWRYPRRFGVATIDDINSRWKLKLLGYVTVDANGYRLI